MVSESWEVLFAFLVIPGGATPGGSLVDLLGSKPWSILFSFLLVETWLVKKIHIISTIFLIQACVERARVIVGFNNNCSLNYFKKVSHSMKNTAGWDEVHGFIRFSSGRSLLTINKAASVRSFETREETRSYPHPFLVVWRRSDPSDPPGGTKKGPSIIQPATNWYWIINRNESKTRPAARRLYGDCLRMRVDTRLPAPSSLSNVVLRKQRPFIQTCLLLV